MKNILLLLFFLVLVEDVIGQSEKIKIENSEEEMDTVNYSRLLNSYNKLIRAEREELSLFKIDLLNPANSALINGLFNGLLPDSVEFGFTITISYEQKIKPNLSWIVGTNIVVDPKKHEKITNTALNTGVRYYYNMNRRILKGKSANNFSANYIGTSMRTQVTTTDISRQIAFSLVYGLQRRIGKYGFFDFNVGFGTGRKTLIIFTSDIQFGIAF